MNGRGPVVNCQVIALGQSSLIKITQPKIFSLVPLLFIEGLAFLTKGKGCVLLRYMYFYDSGRVYTKTSQRPVIFSFKDRCMHSLAIRLFATRTKAKLASALRS